jgi:alcohol dehydrogenase (cytochrome c)/quinohemoprotein ethanol dehydrogenase
LAAALALAVGGQTSGSTPRGGVTDAALRQVPDAEWLSYGRDYGEQRFSPLTGITDANVGELGLAWSAEFDTARGQESTPLVHDGVLYLTTAWSKVMAFDARTGALKWSYDPAVPRETLIRTCCDAVNRGAALYGDKVYVAALDGRLIALDRKTGKVIWSKIAAPNQADYTITGAPRVAKGKVFIGSAGAEYRARGYLAAFDSETGKELWRFHTVPGNPADGFENPAMERAAKTWAGEWWKFGGGGTVWDAITYDPSTNLVLFGTGNAEPWNPASTGRGGDNLFASSVVAVDADTGRYAWHFQETPEDRWDFDSDAQITLADLTISGRRRHVALHAPKNGYFYVLDARTGAFISAGSLVPQNWTTGIDPKTGRPTIAPEARYEQTGKLFLGRPGPSGAHNWAPMSFSPRTGLVYVPTGFLPSPYRAAKNWQESEIGWQVGLDFDLGGGFSAAQMKGPPMSMAALVAWDPVAQKEAWRAAHPAGMAGGALATAGNLVLHGNSEGEFAAYSADKGAKLWSFDAQSGAMAGPMSYALDGEQYVAVVVGWGGQEKNISRILVFKRGAKSALPEPRPVVERVLDPPPFSGTPEQLAKGSALYGRYCFVCHGPGAVGGVSESPDLRFSGALGSAEAIKLILIDGALKHNGMVSFAAALSPDDAEAIRQYVIKRANDDKSHGG